MALKTLVKVGNISNLSDARYCAGMGVDLLGFCMDKSSPDYVDPKAYKEIVGWVSGPKFVGEFESADPSEINEISGVLKLDYIQVQHLEEANQLAQTHTVIFKIDLAAIHTPTELTSVLSKVGDQVEYILLESDQAVDKTISSEINALANSFPILKGYDLDADSILAQRSETQFTGLSLKGSQELKPGFKDYDALADILEALEEDD